MSGTIKAVRASFLVAFASISGGCIIIADVDTPVSVWGDWTEREQDLSGEINAIDFDARGTLYVVQGERMRLRIEGNETALSKVSIYENGDTLRITQAANPTPWWTINIDTRISEIRYYLELPYLDHVRHQGHGEMKVGPMTVDRLQVFTGGHADTNFSNINARHFSLVTTDHSNVNIETLDADDAVIEVRSHGDVYAHDVNALDLAIRIENHGEVWMAGAADVANVDLRDHAGLDTSRLRVEVTGIEARDHATASLWAEATLTLAKRDHASIEWKGEPVVDEEIAIGAK